MAVDLLVAAMLVASCGGGANDAPAPSAELPTTSASSATSVVEMSIDNVTSCGELADFVIAQTQWSLDLIGERTKEEAKADDEVIQDAARQQASVSGVGQFMGRAEELGCIAGQSFELNVATVARVCEQLDQLTAHGPAGAEFLELTIKQTSMMCPIDRDPEALASRGLLDVGGYPLRNMGLPVEIEISDNAVWVTNFGFVPALKIDPSSGGVVAESGVASASGVAVAPDGVWLSVPSGNVVIHLDFDAQTVGQAEVGAVPTAIGFGAEAVWVVNADDATLMRVDPATREVVATIELGAVRGDDVAMSGAIWDVAANSHAVWVRGSDTLYNVDPATNTLAQDPIALGFTGRGLALAHSGIWVADPASGNAVRIDPGTGDQRAVPVGLGVCCLAADGDEVWVATSYGEVYRIDADSYTATATADAQQPLQDITARSGEVWVLWYTPDETEAFVARVDT